MKLKKFLNNLLLLSLLVSSFNGPLFALVNQPKTPDNHKVAGTNANDHKPENSYKKAYVSPENYSQDTLQPQLIHLLYTGESLENALKTFADPKESVSVHYMIAENGDIYSLVPETNCAWHAGKSNWGKLYGLNRYAIGIALVNQGITHEAANTLGWQAKFPSYSEKQIQALVLLCQDIIKRYAIKPWNIVGHSDVAPERKYDPGLQFPWKKLAEKGVGLWPETISTVLTKEVSKEEFLKKLAIYGYAIPKNISVQDWETKKVVAAFQAHFRPNKVDGIIDAETSEILNQLLVELKRK